MKIVKSSIQKKLSVKEQRKILMDSKLIPGPKPYIQAAYEAKVRRRKGKMTDAAKGAREAYLLGVNAQRDIDDLEIDL